MTYELSHLRALEAEGIHIMREVAAEFERPCLLFSGGKDSVVMLELAIRAFAPGPIPFPVMHVDTGHNFPEVMEFRDRRLEEAGARLVVASVQQSIDEGKVVIAFRFEPKDKDGRSLWKTPHTARGRWTRAATFVKKAATSAWNWIKWAWNAATTTAKNVVDKVEEKIVEIPFVRRAVTTVTERVINP